jgi:hypothetical protein
MKNLFSWLVFLLAGSLSIFLILHPPVTDGEKKPIQLPTVLVTAPPVSSAPPTIPHDHWDALLEERNVAARACEKHGGVVSMGFNGPEHGITCLKPSAVLRYEP